MTTVGFGDVTPTTSLEIGVATIAMVVGVSFYGYLTAVLTAWFLASDPQQELVEELMKQLTSYLHGSRYPRPVRKTLL